MTDASLILSFDTSGPWLEVLLLSRQEVLSQHSSDMAKGQAEALFPALEDVLSSAGAEWANLDAIGVGTGPGNFTGIRISVSAARGLALALDIPAVGVSILEAVAFGQDGPVLATRDAPLGQLYVQGFGTRRPVAPALLTMDAIDPALGEPGLVCVGPAAEAVAERIGATAVAPKHATASAIARIAAKRMSGEIAAPAPLYLKPADAAPSREAPPVILDDA
ncbi:tRNA (adenosine(37)-N6)-threonylcarbamoyltransferase complex dimerization subunit type 1 TsaB [Roseovarius atlanticus]|uniref:tRNA (adenosine(37)-N6)-threonylcarbamoyltransferase complex dimerization subunit type 1 TsaB n=1 Tax=Roseovarius atlanticus TaxID=1641875 RepID=UPI0009E6989F|nr:tRNA (adenosine(37)-N6)-threonylcarbamoyltransferase complex dimerization subunit type 1 TsaB [Roseovarius atlanticus]